MATPGGLLIDPVDAASFGEAAGVLGDNASLAQFVTFLFVLSVVRYWFGLHSLHRAFGSSSLMDRMSRFALNVFLVGYALLVVELSFRHVLTHVLAHGVGGTGAEERAMATTLFVAAAGIHIAFLYVTSIGSAIFGYGLARRRPARGCRCQQWRAALRLPLHPGDRRGNNAGTPGVRGRGSGCLGSNLG